MFLDKGNILFQLNELYHQGSLQCVSLYSHPGMGKSRLLREFSKEKTVIYFKAANLLYEENFTLLKDLCVRTLGQDYASAKKFADLFRMLAKSSADTPLVLVLDDFPHLTAGNRRFSTLLSSLMQKKWKDSNLFVILCKPASLYEKESAKDTNPFLLRPFTFFEMRRLYPSMSLEEQILLYGITKGNPAYLEYFAPDCSMEEALYQLFFTEKGAFYRLVPTRTREYYSSSPIMRSILASIGGSAKKLQEICDKTQLTPSAASSLLTSLSTHNLVSRIVPVTEDQGSRRALYLISDSVFRFWYTYALPYQSEIEMGKGEEIFRTIVAPALDGYCKTTFEDICRDFLTLQQETGNAPFSLEHVGMWWGQHPTKKRTEYVSIAAADKDKILLGSCFWTDEWIDIDALHDLQKHASLFPKEEQWYYLFSKSDFVSGFEVISGSHVHVYSLEKMCCIAEEHTV